MEKKPLVSIVVPVYNVEKYLDECVESILNQTYQEFEIILVDDGSPDNCPQMCDEWAKSDSRIRVIHKKNAGLGEARNSGLEVANGEYIYFLDSDDYITTDCISSLVTVAVKEDAELVGSGQYRTDDFGNCYIDRIPDEYRVYRGAEIKEIFLPDVIAPDPETGHFIKTGTCIAGQLFAMRVIKSSGWRCASEREIISEDIYSFSQLCQYVTCAVEVPICAVYYRKNPESLSQTYRADRFTKNVEFYLKYIELIESIGASEYLGNRIQNPFFNNTIACLKQIVVSRDSLKSKLAMIKSIHDDQNLQNAIRQYNFRKEKISYKALFVALKHKATLSVYSMVVAKAKIQGKNA